MNATSFWVVAIQSTLEKGVGSTTLEFKISFVRPITPETGPLKAEGTVISRGRRVGTAEGRVTDSKGAIAGPWHHNLLNFGKLIVVQSPTTAEYARGALYGFAAVSIWAGFIVVARLGIRTSLTPSDIAAIRFTVSGSSLLPYVIREGLALERLGWIGLAAVVAGCGAPMVLLANAGLLFAPAAHAGALFPGVTPLMVGILAAAILREPFVPQKRVGCTLIVVGVIGIVWGAGGTIGTRQNIGHLLFLAAGLAWACYTVAMRRARLNGLHAASLAAVASLALYLPIYAYFAGTSVFKAPLSDIALQAIVQGFLTGIVALSCTGACSVPQAGRRSSP